MAQKYLDYKGVQTLVDNIKDKSIPLSQKGAVNGIASLDNSGKVPTSQLPSYVDDVLEFNNYSSFPIEGEKGKLYIDISTTPSSVYRWTGTTYLQITGIIGAQGETGAQGYRGYQGLQGTKGLQGTTGLQGTKGTTGAQGATGLQGATGAVTSVQVTGSGNAITNISGTTQLVVTKDKSFLPLDTGGVVNGPVTTTKLIKSGGTSSQFLKADGSVDSTSYLPLAGGTMTGNLNMGGNYIINSKIYETNLKWGNQNHVSDNIIDVLLWNRGNRLAGIKSEFIKIEHSQDGGITWFEGNYTAQQKQNLLINEDSKIYLGGRGYSDNIDIVNDKTRITITFYDKDSNKTSFYGRASKLMVRYGVCSLNRFCNLKLKALSTQNDANNIDEWVVLGSVDGLTQNPNNYYFEIENKMVGASNVSFGGYRKFRIEYEYNDKTTNIQIPATIIGIKLFGGLFYTAPSFLSKNGQNYNVDGDLNTTFPAKVTSQEPINYDAKIKPTQTGNTVTKTNNWVLQYLAQGVHWLRDNKVETNSVASLTSLKIKDDSNNQVIISTTPSSLITFSDISGNIPFVIRRNTLEIVPGQVFSNQISLGLQNQYWKEVWAGKYKIPNGTSSQFLKADGSVDSNTYATLDSTGKVPTSQLPSYVDDVVEYTNRASFPTTGEKCKIYVDTTENDIYRWTGSTYIEISGIIGAQGEKGAQGATGLQGATGTRGVQGYQGLQGSKGETGAQGFQGFQGKSGVDGLQGFQGFQGKSGVDGIQGEKGEAGVVEVIHTTYSELYALKNSGSLKTNTEYAIMDYTFTCNSEKYQGYFVSKGGFAVIVRTDENGELKHKARAMYGTLTEDNSFDLRGIERWELMYDIENDSAKYDWADKINGKGVVYFLKDEWGNEAYFDFKCATFSPQGVDFRIFSSYENPTIDTSLTGDACNNKILSTADVKSLPILMAFTSDDSSQYGKKRMCGNVFQDIVICLAINANDSVIISSSNNMMADLTHVRLENIECSDPIRNLRDCSFVNGTNLNCSSVSDVVLESFSNVSVSNASNIRNVVSSILLKNVTINDSNNILLESCSQVSIVRSRNLELYSTNNCSFTNSENIRENNSEVSVNNSTGVEVSNSIESSINNSVNVKISEGCDVNITKCFNFDVSGSSIKMTNCRGGGKVVFEGASAEFTDVDGQIQLMSVGDDVLVQNIRGCVILPFVELSESCAIRDTKNVRILKGENIGRIDIHDCGDVVVDKLQNGLRLVDCGNVNIWSADNVDLSSFSKGVFAEQAANFSCDGRYGGNYSLEVYCSDKNIELYEYLDRDDSGFIEELYFVDWKIDEEGKVYKIENNKWVEVTKS